MKKLKKIDKILIIIALLLTAIRVYLQVKMPLYLQGGAGFDDFLLTQYGKTILEGNWLGTFNQKTLAKGVSFSIYIIVNYLLGIPYSLGLILTYIFAIILFLIVIRKYISNKYFIFFTYIFLLYSPLLFHIENGQKVYRGGVIISFALITISAFIGIYNSRNKTIKKMLIYSMLGTISLPFFYYLKEDSIWVMPFILLTIMLTIGLIFKEKQNKKVIRILLTILPIIALIATNFAYCKINEIYYGEFTITDRSGTYFKEMMADIMQIEDNHKKDGVWISKKMFFQAVDASKTLQSIKPELEDMYGENAWSVTSDGEIHGDMIFWTFKEAANKAGIYDKGGKKVNQFYKKIHRELQKGYKTKRLKKEKNKIHLSSIAVGFTAEELVDYYVKATPEILDCLITYKENETSLHRAYGSMEEIMLMENFTNSTTVWPSEIDDTTIPYQIIINISDKIVKLYQTTGYLMIILGVMGILILTKETIKGIIKKKPDNLEIWLIVMGFIMTSGALLFGVEWFCSWFDDMRHMYNYSCGLFPFMQIVEMIGIYFLITKIMCIIKEKKENDGGKYEERRQIKRKKNSSVNTLL